MAQKVSNVISRTTWSATFVHTYHKFIGRVFAFWIISYSFVGE
jgi:hypothetical protein